MKMVLANVSLNAALIRSVRERSSTTRRVPVQVSSSLSAISFSRSTFGIRPKRTADHRPDGTEWNNKNYLEIKRCRVTYEYINPLKSIA